MKRLLILGAGTAGTMAANRLRKTLDDDWQITVVDLDSEHIYQPGLLFIPFGTLDRKGVVKPRFKQFAKGINTVLGKIDLVKPELNQVLLLDGTVLPYDQLIIATGTTVAPEETERISGDSDASEVHEFYTLEGAEALAETMKTWKGGKLVVHVTEMPIKCPIAPLEFVFLADAYFKDHGIRDQVELTYVTPLPGAFTKPVAAKYLGDMLDDRSIAVESDFYTEHIDTTGSGSGKLVSFDERVIDFDLLVTVPINMGSKYIERSGLGDELRHVPVDKHTLLANGYNNIFVLGDASNIPTSKAGSVAHFAVEILQENFLEHIAGKAMTHSFDGHANCFIETGNQKATLLDFNYTTEPLPGTFPAAKVGPLALLTESRMNHLGKLAFRWAYWHLLLPGRNIFLPSAMSMSGKIPADQLDLGSPASTNSDSVGSGNADDSDSSDSDTPDIPIPSF